MENIGSNTQGGAGMLHFPSPPNANETISAKVISSQDGITGRNVMRSQNLVDNFITIRVWLKIEEDLGNECLKKLFQNHSQSTLSHTAIADTQHPHAPSVSEH